MQKKIFIKTFGCQMNVYDSKKILDILKIKLNFIKTKNKTKADIIILNTCSIREKAKEKFFSELGRLSIIKKKKNILICVGGCVAQEEKKKIFKRSPNVDIIFGPKTLYLLPKMIKNFLNKKKKIININLNFKKKFSLIKKNSKNKNPIAYLSIIEGCNKYCSFCIVPYTRGKEISKNIRNILKEINQFIKQGKKEIILLGQNVNAFKNIINKKKKDFSDLIQYISNISKIKRIKFITSHPKEFTDKLINTYINTKLVNHIYLPVQHASNKILKKMHRGYSIEEYKNIIYKIKKIRPNISISSDFIIGFPGETDKDFKKLVNLINEIKYDTSYSFIYSPRFGTPAANFKNDIPEIIKKYRLQYIQKIINKNVYKINKNMIGTIQKILVEGISKKNPFKLTGKTENNKIVNFYSNKKKKIIGKIIYVKIIKAFQFSLKGKIII